MMFVSLAAASYVPPEKRFQAGIDFVLDQVKQATGIDLACSVGGTSLVSFQSLDAEWVFERNLIERERNDCTATAIIIRHLLAERGVLLRPDASRANTPGDSA